MSTTKKEHPSLTKALGILLLTLAALALLGTFISWTTGSIDLPTLISSLIAIALIFYLCTHLLHSAKAGSQKTPERTTQPTPQPTHPAGA